MYNQDQYLVLRQLVHAYVGGRNYLNLNLGYLKIKLFLDIWGAKMTADNYMRYDIIDYGDFCQGAQWSMQVGKIQTYFEIDVNECLYGIIGSLTGYKNDCTWMTYYINHPMNDFNLSKYQKQGILMKGSCQDGIPDYYSSKIVN